MITGCIGSECRMRSEWEQVLERVSKGYVGSKCRVWREWVKGGVGVTSRLEVSECIWFWWRESIVMSGVSVEVVRTWCGLRGSEDRVWRTGCGGVRTGCGGQGVDEWGQGVEKWGQGVEEWGQGVEEWGQGVEHWGQTWCGVGWSDFVRKLCQIV